MSDNDSKDPKDLQGDGGASGADPFADPFGSSSDGDSNPFGSSDGGGNPFGGGSDPFGDADPFGLTDGDGGATIPVADEPEQTSGMYIEVEFEEESADPFGSFADEPAAAEPASTAAPEAPAADTGGADDAFLSPADLSAMGRFGRSRSSANLIQDDVFGGSSGGPTPSPSKPADSFSSADFGADNPFGSGGRTTDSSPFDTPSSEPEAKATEAAADDDFGDDPFASLGEPLVNEELCIRSSRSNWSHDGWGDGYLQRRPVFGRFRCGFRSIRGRCRCLCGGVR